MNPSPLLCRESRAPFSEVKMNLRRESRILPPSNWAMLENIRRFRSDGETPLLIVGAALLVLALWLIVEAILRIRQLRRVA